jgi:diguanylate cyclase
MKAAFDRARKALDFLETHRLDPSPDHYGFALAVVLDPASELARAVARRTDGGLRLTAEDMLALRGHAPLPVSAVPIDQREQRMARQTEELGSLTSEAHDLTEALGRDVSTMVDRADAWPADAGDFVSRLSDAERELAELRSEFAKLRTDLDTSSQRRQDSDRDELTQALNLHGASDLLESLAEPDRSYVMMLFSVDDLVGINERFGHAVGDNVLNAFAATLRHSFADVELIRWSGNEFVLVATDIAMAAARLLAGEALAAFQARRLKLRGTGEWIGVVTASCGIAVGQGDVRGGPLTQVRRNVQIAARDGGGRIRG